MAYKAKLQSKSSHQKDNCIYPGCKRTSTQEAVYGRTHIRCCNNEKCEIYAMQMAVDSEEGIQTSLADSAQYNYI